MDAKLRDKIMKEEHHDFQSLVDIMKLLRDEGGCPWDREQTHESIRQNFIEETYEVIEAIDNKDASLMQEELGDVLLQVVFHTEIERERGVFDIDNVTDEVCTKLIRRHPHIFGDVSVGGSADVLKNWEKIKNEEKSRKTAAQSLASIPPSLPSLMKADKMGRKAAKVGFDFPNASEALKKVYEEADEVKSAIAQGSENELHEEIGDLLFAAVNVARLCGVEPEKALGDACAKFLDRFSKVEKTVNDSGKQMDRVSMEDLDTIWNAIKH